MISDFKGVGSINLVKYYHARKVEEINVTESREKIRFVGKRGKSSHWSVLPDCLEEAAAAHSGVN